MLGVFFFPGLSAWRSTCKEHIVLQSPMDTPPEETAHSSWWLNQVGCSQGQRNTMQNRMISGEPTG